MLKTNFNLLKESSWRLCFDATWNNASLQRQQKNQIIDKEKDACEKDHTDQEKTIARECERKYRLVMRLLDQREHLLGKCRVLWDELQRRDTEEDYDNLVDVSGHDSAVVEEEE